MTYGRDGVEGCRDELPKIVETKYSVCSYVWAAKET